MFISDWKAIRCEEVQKKKKVWGWVGIILPLSSNSKMPLLKASIRKGPPTLMNGFGERFLRVVRVPFWVGDMSTCGWNLWSSSQRSEIAQYYIRGATKNFYGFSVRVSQGDPQSMV